ncbi:MAG TPA: GSCFA domain-containing protein [Parafilimonas sp.]|nr:GSCFA domain-containing protein [Parafilimonas sp.]
MLNIQLPKADQQINHQHKILSIGSCFTEHIGNALTNLKFDVLQNPNGILFDPISVCSSIVSYIQNKQYSENDLFQLNEIWQSWQHHGRFSGINKEEVLANINQSQIEAHHFLKATDWLIVTLGSSFSYRLLQNETKEKSDLQNFRTEGRAVANCHRAPAQWFQKYLIPVNETIETLDNTLHQLFYFNTKVNIIFTISPVRHIRDGVVDNNRSKARLIEAVHHLVNKFDRLYYFPAYELVIDVLRDYRFYSEDMVHPNYLATDFVLEKFLQTYMSEETNAVIQDIKKLLIARRHKPSHPSTEAHKKFMKNNAEKVAALQQEYPYLNFEEEKNYFSGLRN